MSDRRRTPLYPAYARLGAKIVDFAGWELPVLFSGIAAEHRAVRTSAGLFDVSHMGEIRVAGADGLAYLQHILVNDCARCVPGRIIYSPMCYHDGGCVDDLLVYMLADRDYLLVVNAANTAKDLAWLRANAADFAVKITDQSASYAQLALQGPAAAAVLAPLTGEDLDTLKYYWFRPAAKVAGVECLLSRTGYTGEDGFELYTAPENALPLWEAILAGGQAVPAGLGARDTLRLEAGLPLYGHELSPSLTPLEAGLDRFVAFGKPGFIGRDALAAQAEKGPARKLIGLELTIRGVPRAEYPVTAGGAKIGEVTSGTISPSTDRPLAMALVRTAAADQEGLAVLIRDKEYPAQRVPLPFYNRRRR